jgi:hypothetical protein
MVNYQLITGCKAVNRCQNGNKSRKEGISHFLGFAVCHISSLGQWLPVWLLAVNGLS